MKNLRSAQIEEIDAGIESLYYDLWVPLTAFFPHGGRRQKPQGCEYVLNETINLLDLRTQLLKERYH